MGKIKDLNKKVINLGIVTIAKMSGLNKSTVSRYANEEREYSFENYVKINSAVIELEKKMLHGRTGVRDASFRVLLGEDWQIAYFDFIDSFLATKSEHLLTRPVDGLEIKLLALISSIVMQLCEEQNINPPEWAKLNLELEEPWFVSKFKSLRALCLIESPVYFKRNNIFVASDFLKRA
jgi:hypothetical protein